MNELNEPNPLKTRRQPRTTLLTVALCWAGVSLAWSSSAQTLMEFDFNEGTGSTVTSKDGLLTGTFVGSPTFSTDTPSGATGDFSLQFAAGQRVNVPDPNKVLALDPADASFTVEAWVKLATPSARSVFFYNNGPGGAISASVFTNRTVFCTTLGVKDQPSNAAIPDDGKWHHIAVVHQNKKEFRFYVDGTLGDTVPYTSGVIFTRTNQVFTIGSENVTNQLQFVGLLDRLRYSKGALTPDQLDARASAQDSVSITLGTTNVQNGLVQNEPDGGATTVVTKGGSEARSTIPPAGKTGQFMYFATDPAFANQGSVSNLFITVEYFDEGTNAFTLEYDAQPDPANPNPDTDPYTLAGTMYKYDSKQWLTYQFALHNVYFGKRQPGNSDFRINDLTIDSSGSPVDGEGPEFIRKVTVSKVQPTAWHIKYAAAPVKIDGTLDDAAWQSAQIFAIDNAAQDVIRPSSWKGTNDYSALCRFAWDTNYLYASFDVTDDVPRVSLDDPAQAWNGDGAEIFFGFDQSNPARTDYLVDTDFHICLSAGPNPTWDLWQASGLIWTNTPGDPFPPDQNISVKDRAAGLPKGYVLEARIPWAMLVGLNGVTNKPPTPGQLVGFSLFGNDGDNPDAPAQEKAFSFTGRPGPSNNPSSWTTVQLDAAAATNQPTLSVTQSAAGVSVTFTGTLQSAAKVIGPYSDVAGATSPLVAKPSDAAKFYRARQ